MSVWWTGHLVCACQLVVQYVVWTKDLVRAWPLGRRCGDWELLLVGLYLGLDYPGIFERQLFD